MSEFETFIMGLERISVWNGRDGRGLGLET
jgi:hypothetical protein